MGGKLEAHAALLGGVGRDERVGFLEHALSRLQVAPVDRSGIRAFPAATARLMAADLSVVLAKISGCRSSKKVRLAEAISGLMVEQSRVTSE
jgi:hypothetical protein